MNIIVAKYISRWLKYCIVVPIVLFGLGIFSLPENEEFWIHEWSCLVTDDTAANIMNLQFFLTVVISWLILFFLKIDDERQTYKVYSLVWMLYSIIFGVLFSFISIDYVFSWICIFLIAPYFHLVEYLSEKAKKTIKNQKEHIDI